MAMTFIRAVLRKLGFHVHDWGEWQTIGNLIRSDTKASKGELQRSECKTCKKARIHRIWFC